MKRKNILKIRVQKVQIRHVIMSALITLPSMNNKHNGDREKEKKQLSHAQLSTSKEKGTIGEFDYGYVYISICRLIDDCIRQTYAADDEKWDYISQLEDEILYQEYNAKGENSFNTLIKDLADALNERITYIRQEFGCVIRHKDLIHASRLTQVSKQEIMFKPLLPMSLCYNVSETTAQLTVKAAKMLKNKYNTQTVF